MRGNITRRGKSSWRIKFDLGRDPATSKRLTRLVTIRGKRQDAERELSRLVNAAHDGTLVEPSKLTVADHLRSWLASGTPELSPKTRERYSQLAEVQIIPHLGAIPLQKLRPAHIQAWHMKLLTIAGKNGRPLAASTVGLAHKALRRALEFARRTETVSRNVASAISRPKSESKEVECLTAGQMAAVLAKLEGRSLHPIAALALGTGMRRGELLALRWSDLDLDGATVRVERSIEETKQGLRFKTPKTKHGRRTISLAASTVEVLRGHWRTQMELRLALGRGRGENHDLIFCRLDGTPLSPNSISRDWHMAVRALKLPQVTFHALRHTHASAIIASGVDVLTVSRRLGHAMPAITLNVYAHLFERTDKTAAAAIEAALRTTIEQ